MISFLLFAIPAIIFGVLAGCNSAWWILAFYVWEFTLGDRYATWINGGRLGSAGIGCLVLDTIALFVTFILSLIFLPSFSLF
jgi:hypothetical protein